MAKHIGVTLYNAIMRIEAALYGFKKDTMQTHDARLSYYQRKPKKATHTIVLLHGYTANKELWLRFAKQFNKAVGDRYQVIIPDLAGHGESDFDRDWSYTPLAQVERIRELLDHLGVERASVAGNSMGGLIAANFALAYPERTDKLIAIDPAGVKTPEASAAQKLFEQGKSPFLIHDLADFRAFYPLTMERPPWMPDLILRGLATIYQERREAYAQIFDDFFSNDQLDRRLGEITCPLLLIWGDADRIIDISGADAWKKGQTLLQLEVFAGIGHMPMVEQPARTARVVGKFLTS